MSYKGIKAVMADLKKVYQAINEDEAMNALIEFKEKWAKTYPSLVRSWEENWDILSTFFAFRRLLAMNEAPHLWLVLPLPPSL